MKNILNESDFSEIKNRIQQLSKNNKRCWGKMEIQEMLVHCTRQIKLAVGDIKSEIEGPFIFRTIVGRWISLSVIPWPKSLNTPTKMNIKKISLSVNELQNEKNELINYLDKVRSLQSLKPHPFLGELSKKDWLRLITKHIDHHLNQFGQ